MVFTETHCTPQNISMDFLLKTSVLKQLHRITAMPCTGLYGNWNEQQTPHWALQQHVALDCIKTHWNVQNILLDFLDTTQLNKINLTEILKCTALDFTETL